MYIHYRRTILLTINNSKQYKDQESQLPAQIFATKAREVSTH